MYIRDLHLIHFRSYASLELDFSPAINCLTGPNGAGKTNVLDALHFLAFTRGFRSSQDQQVVQEGASFFFDGATVVREERPRQVACNFVKGKGKKLLINQKPLPRLSEHIGSLPMVAILPQDTELINGPSAGRRQFLDMLISQYDPAYLRHLIQYGRLLNQRNAQLKLFAEQRYFDPEQLQLWDAQLIPHGIAIQAGRVHFLAAYAPIFETYFREIVSEREQPGIRYRPAIAEATPEAWRAHLLRQQEKDRVNQYTLAGTHRDDLVFRIDDQSVRNYGSQGQQKTFLIALKLAQYELLAQKTGLAPVLLLDDLFDKLDTHRLGRIARLLLSRIPGQVFITDTSASRLAGIFGEAPPREVRYFAVTPGEAAPIPSPTG